MNTKALLQQFGSVVVLVVRLFTITAYPNWAFSQGWHIPGTPDQWQYGYRFAEETSRGRHLGIDIILPPSTPIVALFDGIVQLSKVDENPSGYGSYIVYEYKTPTGANRTRVIGHLSNRPEYPRRVHGSFKAGDILGYVGFDDENGSGGPHIHEADYGAPYNGTYHYYGYAPNGAGDDVDYDINGNYVGGKFTDPIKLWEPWINFPTYQYPTASQFQSSWNESVHGFAITPPYAWGTLLRQDFQYTVMTFNPSNNVVIIDGSNWVCPGMTQTGWDWSVSPYFVKAYNDHGRVNNFGNAFSDNGNSRYAHLWGEYWIHNWNEGDLGECAIMLDPTLPVNKKQAAPIQGELWNWFRYNGGPYYTLPDGRNLGCPVEPEEYANAGVNFDVIQLTSNGYLYWNESTVTVHPRTIVTISLTPSFTAYALSDTQAYVSSGPVSGGVTYRVLRNGTQAGTLGASYSPITNYPHQLQAASKPLTS